MLRIQVNKLGCKGSISNEDFMIHTLNNLPEEYDVILNGLKNSPMSSGTDALMIEIIQEKLNHWDETLRMNMMKKRKRKGINSM